MYIPYNRQGFNILLKKKPKKKRCNKRLINDDTDADNGPKRKKQKLGKNARKNLENRMALRELKLLLDPKYVNYVN